MIEIKFTDNEGEKHLSIVAPETASCMQDMCTQICATDYFQTSIIYNIKESDVVEVFDKEDTTDDEGAYFKAVIKYVSCDDKLVKYSFVMWAKDIDEARSKARDIIAQNSLQLAEITKLEKSNYTAYITDKWLSLHGEESRQDNTTENLGHLSDLKQIQQQLREHDYYLSIFKNDDGAWDAYMNRPFGDESKLYNLLDELNIFYSVWEDNNIIWVQGYNTEKNARVD